MRTLRFGDCLLREVSAPFEDSCPLRESGVFPRFPRVRYGRTRWGDAMGGWFLQAGADSRVWWRYNFGAKVRPRYRDKISRHNDLSINVLELLGMVIGAWVFLVQANTKPSYVRDSIRMRGDNSSAVAWVNKCRGGKEPRSGALIRILGCLEIGSDWHFDSTHVAGEQNTTADSRVDTREQIPRERHGTSRPGSGDRGLCGVVFFVTG